MGAGAGLRRRDAGAAGARRAGHRRSGAGAGRGAADAAVALRAYPRWVISRLAAQLLAGPKATSVLEVLERRVAVQSQELRAGHLGVRARSTGLSVADIDAALADRSAIVTWVNRGTLHLVRSEDYPWLHALTTPQLATGNATRLRQEGVSPEQADRAMPVIRGVLADGPATRSQLRDALERADIPVAGQAVVHLLLKATL